MSAETQRIQAFMARLTQNRSATELLSDLQPRTGAMPPRVPGGSAITPQAVARRWNLVGSTPAARPELLDPCTENQMAVYERNIEHFIGTVKVPVGLAGPLRVNGLFAHGDYYVPLATTEAALVASYSRGAALISAAGGCAVLTTNEGVGRTPGFAFRDLIECASFVQWVVGQLDDLKQAAQATTRYGQLQDVRITLEGNHVYLHCEYTTGDAAGQNMTTIATDAVCAYIGRHSPIQPQYFFIEANCSGDKKATVQSFQSVRGKKVSAEVLVPATLVKTHLHTTPAAMADYWRMAAVGGVLSGTIGVNGHYANGLAALYLACGQDVACVSESAVGVTRLEVAGTGDLYAAVTLPNIIVGTVGGGTGLPSQHACLTIMGLNGPGHAAALAEVCAGICLAGELSIIGAMCAHHFTRAHQRLARRAPVGTAPAAVAAPGGQQEAATP